MHDCRAIFLPKVITNFFGRCTVYFCKITQIYRDSSTFDMLYLNNTKHFVWYVFCSAEVSSIGVLVQDVRISTRELTTTKGVNTLLRQRHISDDIEVSLCKFAYSFTATYSFTVSKY